jgi:hypothetical protein
MNECGHTIRSAFAVSSSGVMDFTPFFGIPALPIKNEPSDGWALSFDVDLAEAHGMTSAQGIAVHGRRFVNCFGTF